MSNRWVSIPIGVVLTAACGTGDGHGHAELSDAQQAALVAVPTRIQAEDYDRAFETSPGRNRGGQCDRQDGVDMQLTSDPNGGNCNVGWTTPGEWLEFDFHLPEEAYFDVSARVASKFRRRTFRIEIDGVSLGSLTAPSRGWQAWRDRRYSNVRIPAGSHVLRLVFETGRVNLNYVELEPLPATCTDSIQNGGEHSVDCGGSCPPSADPNSSCFTDTDGDRLPDSVETGTGLFVSPGNTGTFPDAADSDGDAVPDGDEVLGTVAGLDLPGMGLNPLRKNILLEYDWFDDALDCGAHSHRPNAELLDRVSAAFANAPVSNPDGSKGISVIHDYGQAAPFDGGNLIQDDDGILDAVGPEYYSYKAANFAANRQGYFHYVAMPHQHTSRSNYSSGLAYIGGDDIIVSLYCSNTDIFVANTIMHELGHNLGLLHGGPGDATNRKPNYNSVMNHLYQFSGVDTDCRAGGDGLLDYSRDQRLDLDESALNESNGTCGGVAWDWNINGVIEPDIGYDINFDGQLSVLSDHDDWSGLRFSFVTTASAGGTRMLRVARQLAICDSVPPRP